MLGSVVNDQSINLHYELDLSDTIADVFELPWSGSHGFIVRQDHRNHVQQKWAYVYIVNKGKNGQY